MANVKYRFFERRKGQQLGKEWLTIYCDLMTNLMLFFLMLFALTRFSSEDRYTVYQSLKRDFTTIERKATFKKVLKIERKTEYEMAELFFDMGALPKISVTEKYIKMRLPSPVLFDPGKAELKTEGKKVLSQIAAILGPISQEVVIEGHTDSRPLKEDSKFVSNWELAGSRALAAVKYLVTQGIQPRRLSAVPYSFYRPLCPDDSEENMSKNRRIEIKIVRGRAE